MCAGLPDFGATYQNGKIYQIASKYHYVYQMEVKYSKWL
jgi:hypothetical protein